MGEAGLSIRGGMPRWYAAGAAGSRICGAWFGYFTVAAFAPVTTTVRTAPGAPMRPA